MDVGDEYELSESDDYEEGDKILLDDLKKGSKRTFDEDDGDQDVYGLDSDDEGEEGSEEAMSDVDMGSDIEDRDDDGMPDDRAWGQRRKGFYNTDYVDQDYAGTLGARDDEAARLEEQEAKNIQRRLMEELNDADFSLADIVDSTFSAADSKPEAIQADISQLTKRQKLDLFLKEAPEFPNLVDDFVVKLTDAKERIIPVLNLVKEGKLKKSSASEFLEIKLSLILNYCTNIAFYVLLKTKRIPVKDHPVLKCLFRYRQLLNQLQPVDDSIIAPQVEKIIEAFNSDESKAAENIVNKSVKGKKMLKILKKTVPREKKSSKKDKKKLETPDDDDDFTPIPEEHSEVPSDNDDLDATGIVDEPANAEKQGKRAITYEMAKNKGLTPKRSKEQRNPRVKHRNKFRKATIRRRGQVRTPRSEIPVYGGEPTGIKIGVKKGRKIM